MFDKLKIKLMQRAKRKREDLCIKLLINTVVAGLAEITPFSYHEVLPLYKICNQDRDLAMLHLKACLDGGVRPSFYVG